MSQEYRYVYFVSYVGGNSTSDHIFGCAECILTKEIKEWETIEYVMLMIEKRHPTFTGTAILNYQLMRKDKVSSGV